MGFSVNKKPLKIATRRQFLRVQVLDFWPLEKKINDSFGLGKKRTIFHRIGQVF